MRRKTKVSRRFPLAAGDFRYSEQGRFYAEAEKKNIKNSANREKTFAIFEKMCYNSPRCVAARRKSNFRTYAVFFYIFTSEVKKWNRNSSVLRPKKSED